MTPPDKVVLSSIAEITEALSNQRLVPPCADASGSTMMLRADMARFSAPANHGTRRAAVEAAIASVDLATASKLAAQLTTASLEQARQQDARVELITAIGRRVPVAAIAAILGIPDAEVEDVIDDVDAVACVIGRGQAPSAGSDDAVDRLTARFSRHPHGPVAALSTLYQSMDATAALVATRLIDRARNQRSAVPVARTIRVAASPTTVADITITTGTQIHLELGLAGLWFGTGLHACPGRALAETIAGAIVSAIDISNAVLETNSIELDPDHRPIKVWLHVAT